jgi:hypothetical protein
MCAVAYRWMSNIEHWPVRRLTVLPCIDSAANGSTEEPMLPRSPNICWVCRKPVSPEESKPDEYGFFAHENCLLTGKPPKSDKGLKV